MRKKHRQEFCFVKSRRMMRILIVGRDGKSKSLNDLYLMRCVFCTFETLKPLTVQRPALPNKAIGTPEPSDWETERPNPFECLQGSPFSPHDSILVLLIPDVRVQWLKRWENLGLALAALGGGRRGRGGNTAGEAGGSSSSGGTAACAAAGGAAGAATGSAAGAAGAAAHTAAGVGVGNTALSVKVGGRGDGLGQGRVDSEGQPGEEAVGHAVSEQGVLHDGVDSLSGNLFAQDGVLGVGGELLGVGVVGGEKLDLGDQVLVEEGLANVTSIVVHAQGLVGEQRGVGVNHDVDVGGTAGVVAREDGLELSNTIIVGQLDTTQPGVVDVGLVGAVTVAAGNNTGVDTGRIAVPHLEVDIRDRLASVDINDLVVKNDIETTLVLDDVLADILASNV